MTNVFDIKSRYFKEVYEKELGNTNSLLIKGEADRVGFELQLNKKLEEIIEYNSSTKTNNKIVRELLTQDIERLDYKITKLVEKLRGAILVERNTTSTIYSTIIPITKEQTNNTTTTATIQDGVIFGISDKRIADEDVTPLNIKNLNFKNLNLKSLKQDVGGNLENFIISNKTHNTVPFEFSIDLRGLVKNSSAIILNLKDYAILEIYKNNNLYKEKSLSNYFNIPVDLDTQSITIRSHPTLHKSSNIHFNMLGRTDLIYQQSVQYETKQVPLNKMLSSLVLDVCDNNTDNEVSIEYYISIDNKEYERIDSANKLSRKELNNVQSIITLSKNSELTLLNLKGFKRSEGDFQYLLPDPLQTQVGFETTVYLKNKLKIDDRELFILVKEDTHIHTSLLVEEGSVYLDNRLQSNDLILLPKGIRSLKSFNELGLPQKINYKYLSTIFSEDNIFISKLTKPVLKGGNNLKYVSLTPTDLITAFGSMTLEDIFIKDTKKEVYVSTIKIKAILNSLNKKTVPYISRLLMRGI